jgi:DNA invertase Pin-like site-specific DNA recombinase
LCGALALGAVVALAVASLVLMTAVALAVAGIVAGAAWLVRTPGQRSRPAVAPEPGRRPGAAAPTGPRLAVGYVWVDANGRGDDLAFHGQAITNWCAAQGLTLTAVVHDVERQPGGGQSRPALRGALDRIAAGGAQTLVVSRLMHVSPTVAKLPPLLLWLSEEGRTLVAIDVRIDTATEAGRAAAFAVAGVAGWEHERLSGQTRRGMEAARARGVRPGRAAVADVPELRDYIVRMRSAGMTLQAIADELNEKGVATLRGGARWRPSSVQRAAGYRRPAPSQRLSELPGSAEPGG